MNSDFQQIVSDTIVSGMEALIDPHDITDAIIVSLERRGLLVVPKVATEAMSIAYIKVRLAALERREEPLPSEIWAAMVTASKDSSHD